jgi:hypothetical protein
MANLPPLFNAQFFDDDGTPLAGGKLYTYATGTTTNQTTYQDQAGATPNANPIVLDSRGECRLWLSGVLEYTFVLKRADGSTVRSWDDVGSATGAVTSINGLTGAAVLAADDIGFSTGTSTTWFSGADVGAALDSVITRANAIPANTVTITDAGNYFTGNQVEAALQELGAAQIPSQTGNSGKQLTTNGTALSWAYAVASTQSATGSATLPGGLIIKWGTSSSFGVDTTDNQVTFGVAFPTNCFAAVASPSTSNGVTAGSNYSIGVHSFTTTGFKVNNDAGATTVTYIAIGN